MIESISSCHLHSLTSAAAISTTSTTISEDASSAAWALLPLYHYHIPSFPAGPLPKGGRTAEMRGETEGGDRRPEKTTQN